MNPSSTNRVNIVVTAARFIVGALFIFSGLIKANDPLGLSYKMQEFFEIWGWSSLHEFTLVFSVLMIAFEIIAGVAVLVGWKMPLFSWLLLLLTLFFTFLTGYALFSGKIHECGCFGDCIPLTAQQSFIKDLILLVLILLIFAQRKNIRPTATANIPIVVLLLTTLFSFGFQWWVLKHLPVVDCLPYRAGRSIPGQLKPPPGAIQDSSVISFVYEKQGKQVEFTADKFPEDFDDTTYKFVRRYDKLIRQGNATPAIKDFALSTASGTDTTEAVLNAPGYSVLVFTKGISEAKPGWLNEFTNIARELAAKRIPVYLVTNDFNNIAAWANAAGLNNKMTVLKCDFVAIKTAARADPTLYLLNQGSIVNKWSYADFDKTYTFIRKLSLPIVFQESKATGSYLTPHTSYLK